MMLRCLFPAVLANALLVGCVLPPPKDFIGYIDLHGAYNASGTQFQILESGVVSPSVQISREAGVLRGQATHELIEMRVEGDAIKGSRGSMPIEIHVKREGNAVVARGMYGGQLVDLAICAPVAAGATATPAAEWSRPCLADNAATLLKMFAKLGETDTMAMLTAVYYH